MPADESTRKIWLTLAELFFLDTEPQDFEYEHAAALLKQAGWDAARTRKVLIELIAPAAGGNLGFLLWPVIGEWAGFDEADICERIECRMAARERNPKGFRLSEWWCKHMLNRLKMADLLARLAK